MAPLDENLKAWHDAGYAILPGPVEFFFWDPRWKDKKGMELLKGLEEWMEGLKAKDVLEGKQFKQFIEWVETVEEEARPTLQRLSDRRKIPRAGDGVFIWTCSARGTADVAAAPSGVSSARPVDYA